MLQIKVGQRILLVKGDASITDTVIGYSVGYTKDGEVAVLGVKLENTPTAYYPLAKKYSIDSDSDLWTVDEIDCCAPEYVFDEVAVN